MGLARPSDEHGARPHFETGPYVHYCEHRGCIRASASPVGRSEPNRFCFKHRPDWKTGLTTQAPLTARATRGISEL
ncbi:hypothetical protein CN152_36555 [Sinorhizobium meliloti]|nr:hypothetical protein CN152_36555 [Sinorhizobium meliloti]RVN33314.1 hypothetical protein CN113_36115 [Sinorhizobium meliloti]